MKILTISLAVLVIFLIAAHGCLETADASWRARSDSLFSAAEERFERSDYEGAAELYGRAIETVGSRVDSGVASYFVRLVARSRFLAARSNEHLEEWGAAIEGYEACLTELPEVEDVIRVRLAACESESGNHAAAVEHLRHVIDDEAETSFDLPAVFKLAEVYESAEDYDRALQWYRVFLAGAGGYGEKALAHYRLGRTYEKRGDKDAAKKSYATAVEDFPRSHHSYDALQRARRISRAFTDRYHQGLVLYNRSHYKDAAEFFLYYIRHDREREFEAEAEYFLGRSHQRRGHYGTAANRYEKVIESGPDVEYFDLAWSKLAYCRRATGSIERSLETYDDYLKRHSDREAAPDLLWEKARLLEEKGRLDEAVEAFAALSDTFPDSELSGDARFRSGLCLFKQESYGDAEAVFAATLAGAEDEEAARALFWAGKCREILEGADAAAARYLEATEAARDSYYGRRARARLSEIGHGSGSGPSRGGVSRGPRRRRMRPFGWGGESLEFAAWLAEWYHLVYLPAGRVALRGELEGEPAFARADALLGLRMREAALDELSTLADDVAGDPRKLDLLIDYCERNGLHKRAILLAERLLGLSPATDLTGAPVYLVKRICPVHFEEDVTRECAVRGLDPNVFFSLMRQESLFEPDAVSWVGARGLSQIMPPTGRWLARRLGLRGFRNSHLFDPTTNIVFGTEYLALQLAEFDGDMMRALAAYNGGPESAARWWDYGGGRDTDVFVEDIGYEQTADYVRRVYLYSEIYREVYGD